MSKFRFEDFEVWELAVEIGDLLLDIADDMEKRRLFAFADQLRRAALSVSNNIAEGSGSDSGADFAHFLNMAKRSAFENANMLIVFRRRGLVDSEYAEQILELLDQEARKLSNFIKSLSKD